MNLPDLFELRIVETQGKNKAWQIWAKNILRL
jgi:hypothetical protein